MGQSPRTSHSSRVVCAIELPGDGAGLSHGGTSMSFGAPGEDQMLIAVSESGLLSSGEEGEAELDSELMTMLARDSTSTGLR